MKCLYFIFILYPLFRSLTLIHKQSQHITNRCLLPLIINYFIQRFSGTDLLVNGHGIWCTNYELHNDSNDFLVLTVDEYTNYEITRDLFSNVFIILACIFMGIDVAWILMIWGAASLGSPTVPNGRDDYLRYVYVCMYVCMYVCYLSV